MLQAAFLRHNKKLTAQKVHTCGHYFALAHYARLIMLDGR